MIFDQLERKGLGRPGADPRTPVLLQSFTAPSLEILTAAGTRLPIHFLVNARDAAQWLTPDGIEKMRKFATGLSPDKTVMTSQAEGIARVRQLGHANHAVYLPRVRRHRLSGRPGRDGALYRKAAGRRRYHRQPRPDARARPEALSSRAERLADGTTRHREVLTCEGVRMRAIVNRTAVAAALATVAVLAAARTIAQSPTALPDYIAFRLDDHRAIAIVAVFDDASARQVREGLPRSPAARYGFAFHDVPTRWRARVPDAVATTDYGHCTPRQAGRSQRSRIESSAEARSAEVRLV